jgi:hypothetical protein
LRTKEYFKRLEVFPTSNKISSMKTNPQNTIICVVDLENSVSIYTKDFKFLFKLEDYKAPDNEIFTTFSPNGEYFIMSSKEIKEIIVVEIETQKKNIFRRFFRYLFVHFVPFKDFMIIKAFRHLSTTNEFLNSGSIENKDGNPFIPLFDFQNKIMYMFTSESCILRFDLDSMELIDTKENSGVDNLIKKGFLMKNGNLFVFSMFDQFMLDKNLKILRHAKSSLDFNYLNFLDVVETENYLISILTNTCLAIQDPETLSRLILYKRKHEFSSILYLGANPKDSCILTGVQTSTNVFAWFLNGNSKIIQLLKRNKATDVQFHFEEIDELFIQNQTSMKIEQKVELEKFQKKSSNSLFYISLSVLIVFISFLFLFKSFPKKGI